MNTLYIIFSSLAFFLLSLDSLCLASSRIAELFGGVFVCLFFFFLPLDLCTIVQRDALTWISHSR